MAKPVGMAVRWRLKHAMPTLPSSAMRLAYIAQHSLRIKEDHRPPTDANAAVIARSYLAPSKIAYQSRDHVYATLLLLDRWLPAHQRP